MIAEGRRQAYLAALGLPQWSARLVLPGARPAPALVPVAWREVVDSPPPDDVEPVDEVPLTRSSEPVSSGAVVTAEPAPESDTAGAIPVADGAPTADPAPEQPVLAETRPLPAAPTAVAPVSTSTYPRFAFQLVALAPNWLACLDLGEAPDLNAAEHQLLQALTVALNPHHPFEPAGATVFAWPLLNNPAWPRDAVAAKEAVTGFLLRRLAPEVRWLVLGEGLLPYLPPKLLATQPVVAPALAELLPNPTAKRALWQALAGRLA